MKLTVKIPATSANLGPGFDCMGVAIKIYNKIFVEETGNGLKIDILDEAREFLPRDSRNLVYRSMRRVFDITGYKHKGLHITLDNKIPVTRGLGSSSASVVGGLLAANRICGDYLSCEEILKLATEIEGHPDNVVPALTGGLAIVVVDKKLHYEKININGDKLLFAVFTPDFILRTKKSRDVLPKAVPHKHAVFNVCRAAMLTAAIINEDYEKIRVALGDRLHQPYRKKLIEDVGKIFGISNDFGALGCYISGAGPCVVALVEKDKAKGFASMAGSYMAGNLTKWQLQVVEPDNQGAIIIQ